MRGSGRLGSFWKNWNIGNFIADERSVGDLQETRPICDRLISDTVHIWMCTVSEITRCYHMLQHEFSGGLFRYFDTDFQDAYVIVLQHVFSGGLLPYFDTDFTGGFCSTFDTYLRSALFLSIPELCDVHLLMYLKIALSRREKIIYTDSWRLWRVYLTNGYESSQIIVSVLKPSSQSSK